MKMIAVHGPRQHGEMGMQLFLVSKGGLCIAAGCLCGV